MEQKTTLFNLIILDESGSMGHMTAQTISGCNETLNTVRSNAAKNADKLNCLVSIYAFQNGGEIKSRYLVKNVKADAVANITERDYRPWGNTPLLDAVGSTLSELKTIADTHPDSTAIVTIMTDGYENASTHYNWQMVAKLISQLREIGWTINLIGANVDVERMAAQMNINVANSMAYQQTEEGTKSMWSKFNEGVSSRIAEEAECCMPYSTEERIEARKSASKRFFKS